MRFSVHFPGPADDDPRGIPQQVRGDGRILAFFGGCVCAVICAFSLMGLLANLKNPGTGLAWCAVTGGAAFYLIRRAKRPFSQRDEAVLARFTPLANPAALGGDLAGMVVVPRRIVATRPTRVSLACERVTLYRDSDRHTRTHRQRISEVTERTYGPNYWQARDGTTQLVIEMPIRGGLSSTSHGLTRDAPKVEWQLEVEVPTAAGEEKFSFIVPVSGVAVPRPAPESFADLVRVALQPPPLAPVAPEEHHDVLAAAGVSRQGNALVFDPAVAAGAQQLPWIGAAVCIVFIFMFGGCGLVLLAVPHVGPYLLLLWAAALLWAIVCVVRDAKRRAAPLPRRVHVAGPAVVVEKVDGSSVRFDRTILERLEIEPAGSMGRAEFFNLVGAEPPAAGAKKRRRHVILRNVRTRAGAIAVGHWLAEQPGAARLTVGESTAAGEMLAGAARFLGRKDASP